ncbi:MAG: hypothetical protein U1F36_02280 [Planctomycetota bacterium]
MSASDRNFLRDLGAELEREVDGWRGDGSREWDRIRFEIVDDGRFDASVTRDGALPAYTIAIHSGLPGGVLRIARTLLRSTGSMVPEWRGLRRTEAPRRDLASLLPDGDSRSEQIEWLARHMTRLATRFALHHELAHLIRGHLAYESRMARRAKAIFGLAEARFGAELSARARARWRHFEVDADRVGADFFAQTTALGGWREAELPLRRSMFALTLFSASLTFALLDSGPPASRDGIHARAFVRYLLIVDQLGASLARAMQLRSRDVRRASTTAVFWLADALRAVSARAARAEWRVEDPDAWRRALREKDRIEQRSDAAMERLLDGKSTLLPDVGRARPVRRRAGRSRGS